MVGAVLRRCVDCHFIAVGHGDHPCNTCYESNLKPHYLNVHTCFLCVHQGHGNGNEPCKSCCNENGHSGFEEAPEKVKEFLEAWDRKPFLSEMTQIPWGDLSGCFLPE